MKYRYIGEYADTIQVGENSVPVAPGDFVDLSGEDEKQNANLFERGVMLEVSSTKK